MKKFKIFIYSIILFLIGVSNVYAAGTASLSVSRSTIENGGSVTATVTVKNTAAWNVTITSSGSTSGCTQKFADATSDGNNTTKSFSVTCKATSTGIINFVMSGDITSSDGTNTKISGSKSVTVTKPREKSTNNKLKSLSVEGYEISPVFDKDVNEYSVNVPSTLEKITINATKADNYASLEGTGEKTVEEGVNNFEIIVTSETGVENIYKLTVNVEDQNPIEVKIGEKNYTIVKVAKNLVKPDLFEETTVKIGEFDIPAFYNENSGYTLVGLKDTEGNIELFIYANENYIKYNEFKSDSLYIVFLDIPKVPKYYFKTNVEVNDVKVEGYRLKGDSKILLYGLNLATGKKNYYTYDRTEKTLQIFDLDNYEDSIKEVDNNKYMIYGLSIGVLLLLLLVILLASKCSKMKKIVNIAKESVIEKKDKSKNKDEEDPYNIMGKNKKKKMK